MRQSTRKEAIFGPYNHFFNGGSVIANYASSSLTPGQDLKEIFGKRFVAIIKRSAHHNIIFHGHIFNVSLRIRFYSYTDLHRTGTNNSTKHHLQSH